MSLSSGEPFMCQSIPHARVSMSEEEIPFERKTEDEDHSGIVSSNSNEFNDEDSEAEEVAESNESDDEVVTISREDLMSLQLFRNICFNIRENLEAIKSFKKVDMVFIFNSIKL